MNTIKPTSSLDRYSDEAASLFDKLGARYEEEYADNLEQNFMLDWLLSRLKQRCAILDLGSGTGAPTAKRLANAGHDVTGIDVSQKMISLAQKNVPTATFKQIDMRSFDAPPQTFDVVCSFFSLYHMPRSEMRQVVKRIYNWLREGGYFVFCMGPGNWDSDKVSWMGEVIVQSSMSVDAFLECFREAGFEILRYCVTRYQLKENAEIEEHLFIGAQKVSKD